MADRTLDFLFNHVFLPPQLPYRNDNQDATGDRALMERITELCHVFRDLSRTE